MKAFTATRSDGESKDFYFNENGSMDYAHVQLWGEGQDVSIKMYDQAQKDYVKICGIPIVYNVFVPEGEILVKNNLSKYIKIILNNKKLECTQKKC